MHVVDCLFVIVSSVLAIILGIIVNALRFLKMLQAAKCVHHRELAFQTLCQSVQNADVCLPLAHAHMGVYLLRTCCHDL